MAGQIVNEVARFHQRDKCARQNQSAIRFAPANEDFGPPQLTRTDVDDGLVVRNEFARFESSSDFGHRVTRSAPWHHRHKHGDGRHDDASRKDTEPFEIGVLRLDPRAWTENFDIKAEFVRPYSGSEICTLALGCPTADFPDRSALRSHNTRIAAKRPATRRHLRQKQNRRHQRRDAVVSRADITPQAYHPLAARQGYYVEAIAARACQRLGRNYVPLPGGQAKM